MPILIEKTATTEIWAVREPHGTDYYVYGHYLSGAPRVVASLSMAREIAAA